MFNIHSQLQKEIEDFDNNTICLAATGENKGGYRYSQKDTLITTELYHASKFESGEVDSEGQRKFFLNIVRFRREVAEKQTDMDVKDFLFVPENETSEVPAVFMNKSFRAWAKKERFGKLINMLNTDFSKYGSTVAKEVGGEIVRVPIRTLRNQQDAKSLKESTFVIEEFKDMTLSEMQEYKDWDLSQLDMKWGDTKTVYLRYGNVPTSYYKAQKDEESNAEDEKDSTYVLAVLILDKSKNAKKGTGTTLFIEETECPFREAHWSRVDGRWLGVGEIEKNVENQIFRNMVENMRRRGLLWASKKIFQSSDTDVAQNLIRDVKDGEVLSITPNGNVTQVNMQTQALGEFNSAAQVIDDNANHNSFTFEVSTGEGMASGTPFRLGVLLSRAADSYFALKRENFGMFMEEIVYDLLLPLFKKNNKKEHLMQFIATDEGIVLLRERIIEMNIHENAKKAMLSGKIFDLAKIRDEVTRKITERPSEWLKVPKGFYDTIAANVTLVTTGENMNLDKRIETLTNLYTQLIQSQDPRAEKVLTKIMMLTGEDIGAFGVAKKPQTEAGQPGVQDLLTGGGEALAQPAPKEPSLAV